MRTTKDVKVGSDTYKLGLWAPDKATEILAWLVQQMGPSLKPAFKAFESTNKNLLDIDIKDIDLSLGLDFLDAAISNLSKTLKPAEYSARIKEILTDDILVNGYPLDYNMHFRGKTKEINLVALEVIKYQFADFFEGSLSTFVGSGRQKQPATHPLSQAN
jgi:hypothetical protein